jgi:hypothetical protein
MVQMNPGNKFPSMKSNQFDLPVPIVIEITGSCLVNCGQRAHEFGKKVDQGNDSSRDFKGREVIFV